MTPAQPSDPVAFHAEVARRVFLRLAPKRKPASISLLTVKRVLGGKTRHKDADLIRAVAAQVTAEMEVK